MSILITGGAGYIGSHTCVEFLNAGYDVIVVDNFVNSSMESVNRVQKITGKKLKFYEGDVLDAALLEKIFTENKIEAAVHFAGLKAVGESVHIPLSYYRNNLDSTLTLLETMSRHGVKKLVFSSSATVYGAPKTVPIREDAPVGGVTNPYGRTKVIIEDILRDLYTADNGWSIALLRYFNPIGAHESGLIGEDPNGIPNNLMPYITQVAVGKLPELQIYGDDYPTVDGTCVRDYIHVVDLARGHLKAVARVEAHTGVEAFNLGTGVGYSVFGVVRAFEKATGIKIPKKVVGRREGDVPECYADAGKALSELSWKAGFDIERMCADSWRWQKKNPNGYKG